MSAVRPAFQLILLLFVWGWARADLGLSAAQRAELRQLFLRRFGLDDLVEAEHRPAAKEMPHYIWLLYEEAQRLDHDIVRHFWPSRTQPAGVLFHLDAHQADPAHERVQKAGLRVQLPASAQPLRGVLRVCDPSSHRLLSQSRLPQLFNRYNWVDLDVTDVFHDNPRQVAFSMEFIPQTGSPAWPRPHESAALVLYVERTDNPRQRRKRNVKSQKRPRKHRKHHTVGPKDSTQCKRTRLYVDFAELNWHDWIMAPAGYDAYQCQGRCSHPMPSNLNTTNHAIIQSLIHSIDPSAVPPPSCVPTQTSAISILYRDINNTVVVKTYADMKVDACGCH